MSHCGEVVDVDDLDIENMSADKKESITRTYEGGRECLGVKWRRLAEW